MIMDKRIKTDSSENGWAFEEDDWIEEEDDLDEDESEWDDDEEDDFEFDEEDEEEEEDIAFEFAYRGDSRWDLDDDFDDDDVSLLGARYASLREDPGSGPRRFRDRDESPRTDKRPKRSRSARMKRSSIDETAPDDD